MKKACLFLPFTFLMYTIVSAANKYWVGPSGGNWNNTLNWSLTSGGGGGAGVPSAADAVIFPASARINLDVSPTINSLQTAFGTINVLLYTSSNTVLTILNTLRIEPFSSLKDSTAGNVSFNVVFNAATNATGTIIGDWIFEGGVALSGALQPGATFTAAPGTLVNVAYLPSFTVGGRIIFKKNTADISSTAATLKFSYSTSYIVENILSPSIPGATWAKDSVRQISPYDGVLGAPASTIMISGDMRQVRFLGGVPNFGRFVVDLPVMSRDASLALPDGSRIRGNLEIRNTNNRTLTLLGNATPSVQVEVGTDEAGSFFGGNFMIGGNSKVALSTGIPSALSRTYRMLVNKSFNQTGGNFSLQDFNNASGSTTLAIKNDLIQTGGTFVTNSTSMSPTAKFVVVMDDPNFIVGPSGGFFSSRIIRMSSGSMDNASHMVTLRIDHTIYNITAFTNLANGILLQSPLEVGKLDLARSPITTTTVNFLTVNNQSPDAITVGTTGRSYVNGPLQRATNVNSSYGFPVGKGNSAVTTYAFDSCIVIPASATPSVYRAEYFKTAYPDLSVTAPLTGVSNAEFWDISKVSGADAKVKLILDAAVPGVTASQGLVVAHYAGADWITENGTVLTPGNAVTGSVVSKQLSGFSAFTFGYGIPGSFPVVPPVLRSGLSYRYYEGVFITLPDFNILTPVKTGTSANVDISVRPAGVNEGFAFIWEGTINIPAQGIYTFETISDDGSKLYFNSLYAFDAQALVNNDGTHPAKSVTGTVNVNAAGSYPIAVTFFENYGGEGMEVYWSGPGIPRQLISNAAFGEAAPQPGNGLSYKFYQGSFSNLPDFSNLIPVKTGTSANVNIAVRPAGADEGFAFLWEGYINIQTPGTYTFETISDDGSKLYFNSAYASNALALVNNDGIHHAISVTGSIYIPAAGLYPIAVTFFENYGGESMEVYWSGPGFPREHIPDAAFKTGNFTQSDKGLQYRFFQGSFTSLPDFNTLTPVKTGTGANVNIGVRPGGVNDNFAFIWEGYINIPTAGTYTFETVSDDGSKIYFNEPYSATASGLVSNNGLHAAQAATGNVYLPAPGMYPISITYFEKDGDELMQVFWTGPGIVRQLIPDDAFMKVAATLPVRGLRYKYYEGSFDILPDFTVISPVSTGTSANVNINVRPAGVNDNYAFMWEGYIQIPTAGTYTFETISDDGSKVYFNTSYYAYGGSLVNNDGVHAPLSASGNVYVPSAGIYPVTITFFEKDAGETMQFYWTGPGITRQLVPDAAFTANNDLVISSMSALQATGKSANNLTRDDLQTASTPKIYPNPFTESFTIDYYNQGNVNGNVSIGIYDLKGKLRYTYQPGKLLAGQNRWIIDIREKNLSPGVYVAQLKINGLPVRAIKLIRTR